MRFLRLKALLKILLIFFRAYYALFMRLEELRPTLAGKLEAVDYRLVEVNFRGQNDSFMVGL